MNAGGNDDHVGADARPHPIVHDKLAADALDRLDGRPHTNRHVVSLELLLDDPTELRIHRLEHRRADIDDRNGKTAVAKRIGHLEADYESQIASKERRREQTDDGKLEGTCRP